MVNQMAQQVVVAPFGRWGLAAGIESASPADQRFWGICVCTLVVMQILGDAWHRPYANHYRQY
jgi:hypothetical protein